jgi:hypothetical protein
MMPSRLGPATPTTEIVITARRLDAARANVDPALGTSTYSLSNDAVEARPGGETTTIAQVLLQAPGVTEDGTGQIRVRQSKGAVQYRINNVIIPDGLDDLAETLSPRVAAKVQLVTGALPAQYGLGASAVVNITTKDGVYLRGGQAELYGGSHATLEPAMEYGGTAGSLNFFFSGSHLQNDVGGPAPDGSADPLHDHTNQDEGFVYLDKVLDPQTRLSLIAGISNEQFQIPNVRGLNAATANNPLGSYQGPLVLSGISNFSSEQRDGNRRIGNRYAVLSLLHATDKATLQVGTFFRQSSAELNAAGVGDVLFNGVGRLTHDSARSGGAQFDGVFEIGEKHTLRTGTVFIFNVRNGTATTLALPVDDSGRQTSDVPLVFLDSAHQTSATQSAFVQDEWRLRDFLTLNFGLRADHVSDSGFTTALSPRVNLVLVPRSGTTIHLGYARRFAPRPLDGAAENPFELSLTTARTATSSGDAVKAQFDDYVDIGVEQVWGPLSLGIDAYWQYSRNLADEGQFGTSYASTSFNFARGRLRGGELSLTYTGGRLSAWTNLAFASAYGKGISSNQFYFTHAQLSYAAANWVPTTADQRYTYSGGISYRWDKLRLSGAYSAGSGLPRTFLSEAPNAARMPAYVRLDLSAVYRVATFHDRPLDVRCDIINALDTSYQVRDGTGLASGQVQWGPRRGVFVGVEQAF